jgi:hypothetical protein
MGESFKLHAQALIGYVDEINDMGAVAGLPQFQDQPMMGIEAAY